MYKISIWNTEGPAYRNNAFVAVHGTDTIEVNSMHELMRTMSLISINASIRKAVVEYPEGTMTWKRTEPTILEPESYTDRDFDDDEEGLEDHLAF